MRKEKKLLIIPIILDFRSFPYKMKQEMFMDA